MPNPRCPYALWNPGVNAGYRAGRNNMSAAVCHYTVGRDSTGIGKQGYFHFLISRDGRIQQFAEVDAVCWHAGSPWNGRGPGIEVEYLDEPTIFTPEAEDAAGALVDWLCEEWGFNHSDFYDGPRTSDAHSFITHRSLIQTGDAHSDYWPYLPGGDMEADLTLKALNDIRNVVGGDKNLDGTAVVLSQIVRDLIRIEKKVDALAVAAGGGTPVPLKVTLTGTATP